MDCANKVVCEKKHQKKVEIQNFSKDEYSILITLCILRSDNNIRDISFFDYPSVSNFKHSKNAPTRYNEPVTKTLALFSPSFKRSLFATR